MFTFVTSRGDSQIIKKILTCCHGKWFSIKGKGKAEQSILRLITPTSKNKTASGNYSGLRGSNNDENRL